MKAFFRLFLAAIGFLLPSALFAQGQVNFVVSGKDRGSVESMEVNGVTYVDLQRTARKFGTNVELFAASKQAKVSARGFYAILTAPLEEVIINAETKKLSAPVISNGGKLMVPVEFFLLPRFQKAVDKRIEFKNKSFIIERRFNLSFDEKQDTTKDTLLVFSSSVPLKYTANQLNGHTVQIVLEDAVLKRDVHVKGNNGYIISMSALQEKNRVILKVILGGKTKDWSFTRQNQKFVFRAGEEKAAPVLQPAPIPEIKPAPATKPEVPQNSIETPSVLAEEDDFEEMPILTEGTSDTPILTAGTADTPIITAAAPAEEEPAAVVPAAPAATATTPAKPAVSATAATAATAAIAPAAQKGPHPLSVTGNHKKIRIVVDPGHGGKDPGALRGRYREKDWNLAVAKELVRLLKKGGFDVKSTRETDVFIALGERARISNNFKADLFISLHTNASKDPHANGFQVYFRSEKATDKEAAETAALENEAMQYEETHYNFVDALLQSMAKNEFINESSKLAGYVRKSVYKQPGIGIAVNQKTGVRQANFYVLKGVNSPSVLVEMGFISSSKDRAKLSNAQVQKKMAQGIYNGIVEYTKTEFKK